MFYPITEKLHRLSHIEIVIPNSFDFDKAKIFSSGKDLSLYHTIPTFNDPEKEAF